MNEWEFNEEQRDQLGWSPGIWHDIQLVVLFALLEESIKKSGLRSGWPETDRSLDTHGYPRIFGELRIWLLPGSVQLGGVC